MGKMVSKHKANPEEGLQPESYVAPISSDLNEQIDKVYPDMCSLLDTDSTLIAVTRYGFDVAEILAEKVCALCILCESSTCLFTRLHVW